MSVEVAYKDIYDYIDYHGYLIRLNTVDLELLKNLFNSLRLVVISKKIIGETIELDKIIASIFCIYHGGNCKLESLSDQYSLIVTGRTLPLVRSFFKKYVVQKGLRINDYVINSVAQQFLDGPDEQNLGFGPFDDKLVGILTIEIPDQQIREVYKNLQNILRLQKH